MNLSEHELYDFLYCPLYFHTKYALGMPLENKKPIYDCIKQTIRYFYLALLNEEVVKTYKQVQNKWDQYIKKYDFDSKTIINGWQKIVKVLEWSKTQRINIGDVNCSYMIESNDCSLQGVIDYVVIYPNKEIELLYFNFSDKNIDKLDLHLKSKYVYDFIGFEKVYQIQPQRIRIHDVKKDVDILFVPSDSDIKRALSVLKNSSKIIEQKLYVPRETFLCESCAAKTFCKFFTN